MDFFIFDKNINLLGEISSFDYICWTRNFYDASSVEIQLKFNKELLLLVQTENYIYKKDTKEIAIIENLKVSSSDANIINLSCRGLSSILDRRLILSYSATNIDIGSLFYNLIDSNCINTTNADRKIPNLTAQNIVTGSVIQSIEIDKKNLLDTIKEYAIKNQVGFRVDIDIVTKVMAFKTLIPIDKTSDICFSRNFGNVLEQTYYKQLRDYKNIGYNNEAIASGSAKGLDRREVYTEAINDYKIIDTLETTPNSNAYPEYLKDYNLGDIVMTKNEDLRLIEPKIITQIIENYSEQGKQIELVFGTPIPTLLEKIKRDIRSVK